MSTKNLLDLKPAEGAPITAREVSRAAFELCEFLEDIKDKPNESPATERFKAGQRYAAKSIRKSLGIWLTDEENSRPAAPQGPLLSEAQQAEIMRLANAMAERTTAGSRN